MGLPIKDVDLAVNMPDGGIAFAEWLRKKKLTIGNPVTFPKYGTARLRLKRFPDDELELVQTRSEKYTDRNSRDPSTAFGSIEEDCLRRDLTINSLYYDISGLRAILTSLSMMTPYASSGQYVSPHDMAGILNRLFSTP